MSRTAVRHAAIIAALSAGLTFVGCSSMGSDSGNAANLDDTAPASGPGSSVSSLLGPAEFAAFLEEFPTTPVVNVHIPYEGHLDGTDAFVPFDSIAGWVDLPADPIAPIALYCRSGSMSATASATLADLGYSNIVELDGGMVAWEEAGLALSRDQQVTTD